MLFHKNISYGNLQKIVSHGSMFVPFVVSPPTHTHSQSYVRENAPVKKLWNDPWKIFLEIRNIFVVAKEVSPT